MSTNSTEAKKALDHLQKRYDLNETMSAMQEKHAAQLQDKNLPVTDYASTIGAEKRIEFLKNEGRKVEYLNGTKSVFDKDDFSGNIENYIGQTSIPTGVIGPLYVIGSEARGDFYVPLATSE